MSEQVFGRGQVEWALWKSFTRTRYDKSDAPKMFRTRIKRLLDIDRELDLSGAEVPPGRDFAFVRPPAAAGAESEFSPEDAFSLAVALDLLDSGFKQSEIVFLMRYLRADLDERFPALMKLPSLLDRQRRLAKDYPSLPSFEHKGVRYADSRLFVILQKLELTEVIPEGMHKKMKGPVISPPVFCKGVEDLGAALGDTMPAHRRAVTVVELAATAQAVHARLEDAPVIRRGRPKS